MLVQRFMEGTMGTYSVITILVCIIIIYIIGKLFFLPLKKILKLVLNSILGGILIYVINAVGSLFHFHIGLNVITAIFVRTVRYTGSSSADNI